LSRRFAVRPSHQGRGIGAALLRLVEQRAAEQSVRRLALDTSEHASDLIAFDEVQRISVQRIPFAKFSGSLTRWFSLAPPAARAIMSRRG